MKSILVLLLLSLPIIAFSQEQELSREKKPNKKEDTLKPPISAYKIFTVENDTTFLDTTLSIQKEYKFNYLRKDNFELTPFSNTGQTYNSLSHEEDFSTTMPKFGARARHYNFMEVEDIYYYKVPTPLTELYFKTVPEQGQQLDAFFTINTSERLNFSVAYKGLRALGKYQHILTSTGNFRATLNYRTKNEKYEVKAHFVSQDLKNEENGGLTQQALQAYIEKDPEFSDRSKLIVNFDNAESTLYGKRFYLNHKYHLTNPKSDSLNKITIGHILNFSYQKFDFQQASAANEIFGPSFENSNLRDVTRLEDFYNEASINYRNSILGSLSFKAGYRSYNYGYNSVYVLDSLNRITNRLKDAIISIGGEYSKEIAGFQVHADASLNLSGGFNGNYINATAAYQLNEENTVEFGFKQSSRSPNYNFLLYQSDYINYNWQNDFENVNSQNINGKIISKKYGKIEANFTQIQNYAYFGLDEDTLVKPFQDSGQIRYFKIKAEKGFDFGKFGVYNTLMYQNTLEGGGILKLPGFITRNSLFYKDYWFQKALYLQTGFTFKYFSEYEMNAYDPVLAEFYVQNQQKLGGFPSVDFFFNAKVDQTRIFFKLERLDDLIDQNNNFAAPGYPNSDFIIRFGLVWDFFL